MPELYRSNINRKIAGVCGGIGEYLSIGPDVIRILFAIGSLAAGLRYGFVVHIVAMLLIPEAPLGYNASVNERHTIDFDNIKNKKLIGLALIIFAILLALKRVFYVDDIIVISVVFIILGIYIMVKGGKK